MLVLLLCFDVVYRLVIVWGRCVQQERYVKVANNFFRYFKQSSDADSAALGSVSLETADWVRPYDSSAGWGSLFCCIFKHYHKEHTLIFVWC